MTETTIAEIEREIREVDQLFRPFDDLLTRVKDEDPDLVEMTAVSTADMADAKPVMVQHHGGWPRARAVRSRPSPRLTETHSPARRPSLRPIFPRSRCGRISGSGANPLPSRPGHAQTGPRLRPLPRLRRRRFPSTTKRVG
ncbi:MAG: hypothetical protein GY856_47350 [bacterium]|nr:hypothetical protein [bacterium]